MDAKDAVRLAIDHVRTLFEHEEISNLGLEEIDFDTIAEEWTVTVGFSRPWDYPKNALAVLSGQGGRPHRSFKSVKIHDPSGRVIAIKNHPIQEPSDTRTIRQVISLKQIVIDSNLLVLLVVGLTDRNLIGKHKRTKSFDKEDFKLLTDALANFDQIIVTPHILTEASNLLSQIAELAMSAVRKTLAGLLESQKEKFEASIDVVKHHSFLKLGLTDCAILKLIADSMPLITTDLDLYLAAAKTNHNAINFNHIRQKRFFDI